jgi:hypothetical protein
VSLSPPLSQQLQRISSSKFLSSGVGCCFWLRFLAIQFLWTYWGLFVLVNFSLTPQTPLVDMFWPALFQQASLLPVGHFCGPASTPSGSVLALGCMFLWHFLHCLRVWISGLWEDSLRSSFFSFLFNFILSFLHLLTYIYTHYLGHLPPFLSSTPGVLNFFFAPSLP